MGVWMQGPAPIIRAEERVNHVEIPGRSGDLTETEGNDIYNSYIQTVTILVKGGAHVREVYRWLRGAGFVTFSGEPDRKQAARVIGAVTLTKHSFNLDWWTGECQFYCQPLKQLLHTQKVNVTSSGTSVMNSGDVEARPRITVTCAAGATVVITAGGGTFTVDLDGGSDTGCVIDSGAEMVTSLNGTVNLTALSSGQFPRLPAGVVSIGGSGWTQLSIERRCCFI